MPLFADLDPPPHGLVKLRARLARGRKRRALWVAVVLGPAGAAAATAALVATLARPEPAAFEHPALTTVSGVEVVVDGGARVGAVQLADGVWLVP